VDLGLLNCGTEPNISENRYTSPMNTNDLRYLERAIEISHQSRANGNHPFGALLVLDDQIVLEAENSVGTTGDTTGHAETNLVRLASTRFSKSDLARASLYSSCEPCAMCSGAIYWASIGRLVYALSEDGLYAITGNNPENPTMRLPCRIVLTRGQHEVEILGPTLEDVAAKAHAGFWNQMTPI
jgi:tRNA(Arg) A34 adenosine deaminase TadA